MPRKLLLLALLAAGLLALAPIGCGPAAPPPPATPGAKLGEDPAVDYLPGTGKPAPKPAR